MKFVVVTNIVAAAGIVLGGCVSLPQEGPAEISPFSSDRCSLYPEGPPGERQAWCHCCVEHDLYYWMGGDKEARKQADDQFRSCVERTGHPLRAYWMSWGVRLWGGPNWSTRYRWGYGWPYQRDYVELTAAEKERLDREHARLDGYVQEYCRSGY